MVWAALAWLALKKLPEVTGSQINAVRNTAGETDKYAREYYGKILEYLKEHTPDFSPGAGKKGEGKTVVIEKCPAGAKKSGRPRKMFY